MCLDTLQHVIVYKLFKSLYNDTYTCYSNYIRIKRLYFENALYAS